MSHKAHGAKIETWAEEAGMRRSRRAEAQSRAVRGKQASTALADDLQRPGDSVTNGLGTIGGSGRKRASTWGSRQWRRHQPAKHRRGEKQQSETEKRISSGYKGDAWQKRNVENLPAATSEGSTAEHQVDRAGLQKPALHLLSAADPFFFLGNLLPGLLQHKQAVFYGKWAHRRCFQQRAGVKLSSIAGGLTGEQHGDLRLGAEYKKSSFCQVFVLMWFRLSDEHWVTCSQDTVGGEKMKRRHTKRVK